MAYRISKHEAHIVCMRLILYSRFECGNTIEIERMFFYNKLV